MNREQAIALMHAHYTASRELVELGHTLRVTEDSYRAQQLMESEESEYGQREHDLLALKARMGSKLYALTLQVSVPWSILDQPEDIPDFPWGEYADTEWESAQADTDYNALKNALKNAKIVARMQVDQLLEQLTPAFLLTIPGPAIGEESV